MCSFFDIFKNTKMNIVMSIVLLVSMGLIACNMDKVVDKKAENKTEKRTEVKSNGKAVVIDPGHGGVDPGKIGVNNEKEKDVNLGISLELKKVLTEQGFSVVLTREGDKLENSTGKFSKVGDLNERCRIINDTYSKNTNCVLISIHQNSFTSESVHGAQAFYYQRSENSKMLAEIVQNNLNKEINTEKTKKVKPNDSYYMLINSKCPGIIIECGFLSNNNEAKKLISPEYQKKIATIINKSLIEYFNNIK